jgi:hypothetical protein
MRKRVPKREKNPTFFCKSCSIFTIFYPFLYIYSTPMHFKCIFAFKNASAIKQSPRFTKFALLQEKKRFKAMNPHLLLLQKRKFQFVHYLNCVIGNTILSGVYLNVMDSKKSNKESFSKQGTQHNFHIWIDHKSSQVYSICISSTLYTMTIFKLLECSLQ